MKPDLKSIYLSKETNVNITYIPEDHDVCRLCMGSLKTCSFISLDDRKGEIIVEKMMLEKCLPELDFNATDKPVICLPCCGSLQHYFSFITDCSIVEENIKKYCEVISMGNVDLIKLKDVLEFTIRYVFDKVDGIKMEDEICEDEGHVTEELPYISKNILTNIEQIAKIEVVQTFLEEADCKIEPNLGEMDNQQFDDVSDFAIKCEEGDQIDVNEIKYSYCQEMVDELKIENCEEMLEQKCLPCYDEVEVKTENQNTNSFQANLPEMQKCSVVQLQENSSQASLVKYGKKHENESGRHLSPRESASEKMYQCSFCKFGTKYKWNLIGHLLLHKDPSEITMYQYDKCSFHTKHKQSMSKHIKRHTLAHKTNPSKLTEYQCESCSYQTKYKKDLKKHLVTHKDPSEVTMHHCDLCPFSSKHKNCVKQHLLTHKDPSELTMYRCEQCTYQTKYKSRLNRHFLIHKSPSELTMYKCEFCSYQTKRKSELKTHLVTHKHPSEVTMYKCKHCSFETKYKNSLEGHNLLTHKDPSELTMFRCASCSFETKNKQSLKAHMLIHKDPSEVTMYSCELCPYQSKHKRYVKFHLLTHKDASEVTMYRCEFCPFQSKRKKSIVGHIRTRHKNFKKPSEGERPLSISGDM